MIDRAGTATHPRRGTTGGGKCLDREVWDGCGTVRMITAVLSGPSAGHPVELGELSG